MMKMRSFLGWAGFAASVMFSLASCSSDDSGDDGGGIGGAAGSSGAAGAAGSAGSAGSLGTGGSAGAAGSSGAAGSGGAGGQTGGLSFADDVLPILQTECGDCHAFFIPFASEDAEDSYAVAIEQTSFEGMNLPRYDVIVARVEDGSMPPQCGGGAPGDADCVSEEDFETIQDWANSGNPPSP